MITNLQYIDENGIIDDCNLIVCNESLSPYVKIIDSKGIDKVVYLSDVFVKNSKPLTLEIRQSLRTRKLISLA